MIGNNLVPFYRCVGEGRFQFMVLIPDGVGVHEGEVTLFINGKTFSTARFTWFGVPLNFEQGSLFGFGYNTLGFTEVEVPDCVFPIRNLGGVSVMTVIDGIQSNMIFLA